MVKRASEPGLLIDPDGEVYFSDASLPEGRRVVVVTTAVTLATVFRVEFEAYVQAAVVAAAAVLSASLRAHVLLMMRLFRPKMYGCRVFDLEY